LRTLLLFLILLLAPVAGCKKRALSEPPSGASGALNGEYSITSASRPGGNRSTHAGSVTIEKSGNYYGVAWRLDGGKEFRGVGIEAGEFLAVGWGPADDCGVAVYEIAGERLIGRWASASGAGKLGGEELRGPTGLNGSYTIVTGRTPAGESYDGQLAITPSGNMYRVIRRAGSDELHGAAMKKGSRLFVGWARGGGAVMVYTVKDSKLNGQWAQPGSSQLGTEFLSRR
jgi:hypothetical protein